MAKSGQRALAKRYAIGLAEAAPKELGAAASALEGWVDTVKRSPDLAALLNDPRISKSSRTEIAQEIFSNLAAPQPLLKLLALLIDENRFGILDAMYQQFVAEREKREGIVCAVIESPAALPDQVRERIRSQLAQLMRRHVRIDEKVRPALFGGVNMRIGSRIYYGSARARLEQMFK